MMEDLASHGIELTRPRWKPDAMPIQTLTGHDIMIHLQCKKFFKLSKFYDQKTIGTTFWSRNQKRAEGGRWSYRCPRLRSPTKSLISKKAHSQNTTQPVHLLKSMMRSLRPASLH